MSSQIKTTGEPSRFDPPTRAQLRAQNAQKEIGYAYPSSIWAKDCGFYKTGCYVVRLVTWQEHHVSMVGGFATFTDAQTAADKLPHEYSRWTMKELSAAPAQR